MSWFSKAMESIPNVVLAPTDWVIDAFNHVAGTDLDRASDMVNKLLGFDDDDDDDDTPSAPDPVNFDYEALYGAMDRQYKQRSRRQGYYSHLFTDDFRLGNGL